MEIEKEIVERVDFSETRELISIKGQKKFIIKDVGKEV